MNVEEDDRLRLLAIAHLGPFAPALARDALELGVIEVGGQVLEWTGSTGTVRGHRVVLWLDPDLAARVREVPSVTDALTAAVASAVGASSGNALADLEIVGRATTPRRSTPYRGRV